HSFYDPGVHRRLVQIGSDDLRRRVGRPSDITGQLASHLRKDRTRWIHGKRSARLHSGQLAIGYRRWSLRTRLFHVEHPRRGTGSSPGCTSVFEKSIERLSSLGGVPVFSRPNSSPISFSDPDRPIAASSPARPPDCWFCPMCINPFRNVPVVTTTVLP